MGNNKTDHGVRVRQRPAPAGDQLSLLLTTLAYFLLLSVAGCSTVALSLEHKIEVPAAYSSPAPTEAGVSPMQRYVDAYERGWWNCVAARIKALDDPCRNVAVGWPSEVFGYADGSMAADERVKQLLKSFGKDKTHSYLTSEYNRRSASGRNDHMH